MNAQACAHLSRLASDLEAAAHPALDALTRKVTTGTLERVRRIKTRLVRLKTRVETVRRQPACCSETHDAPARVEVPLCRCYHLLPWVGPCCRQSWSVHYNQLNPVTACAVCHAGR